MCDTELYKMLNRPPLLLTQSNLSPIRATVKLNFDMTRHFMLGMSIRLAANILDISYVHFIFQFYITLTDF